MRFFAAILLLLATANADTIPAAIPTGDRAELRAIVVKMRAQIQEQSAELDAANKAKESLGNSVANLIQTNASQSSALIITQRETLAAVQEIAKVQSEMDAQKLTIAKQEAEISAQAAKLARWQTFGKAVLACVVGVVFGWAWQLLGKIPLFTTAPYAIAYRFAASLAAGLAAAQCLFTLITRLL